MALSRFVLPFADVGSGIKPSDGAKLFFFDTGTGVPKDTFNCPDGTTANSNPVIADAKGVFPDIFFSGTFKVILKDKDDVQKWEGDPVTSFVLTSESAFVKNFDTLALAIEDEGLTAENGGDTVKIKERTTGNDGGSNWEVVLLSSVTPSVGEPAIGNIVTCTGVPTLALVLEEKDVVFADQWGAKGDGSDSLAAITLALATLKEVRLSGNKKYNVSASLLIEDFERLKMSQNTIISGAVSPAVRVKGERGSFQGTDFSSIITLDSGVAADQGVVKIGHALVTDDDAIQYNRVGNFRIIGNDPFGTSGTFGTTDTIGLMMLNLGDFNKNPSANGSVFFNIVDNVLFEDVKEAYLLTASVNATISSRLYFRRIGEFGIHTYAPLIADAEGTNYGVNWDDATRLEGSTAENDFSAMFIDGSFQDTTAKFPIMAFIRLEFRTSTQQFRGVMDESGPNTAMTPAEGYNIDASVTDCWIQGDFNIAPAGTNSSTSTTIYNLSGVDQHKTLRIDNLISDKVQVQTLGSAAAPWLFPVGGTNHGIFWPSAAEMAFSDQGTERYRLGGSTPHAFTGDVSIDGDTILKATYPADDNTRPLGLASRRWSEVFAAIGAINTSDARHKTDVIPMSKDELSAAKQLGKEIGIYKFLSSVKAKGDDARSHVGMTVQRAIEIMESNNLEPFKYGFICHDSWEDEFKPIYEYVDKVDDKGNEYKDRVDTGKTELVTAKGDLYGFRYDQLNIFILAGISARLDALEG